MFIVSHYFIYSFGIHVLWCNMQRGDAYRTEHPFKSPAILLSSRSNTTAVNFLSFLSHSRIFPFFGDVTIAGEELQILTYARHLWPLSSEGSLACPTYCDTGQPFIMVISQDPWQSRIMPSVWQCNCHYLFLRLKSVAARIRTPNLPLAGQTM